MVMGTQHNGTVQGTVYGDLRLRSHLHLHGVFYSERIYNETRHKRNLDLLGMEKKLGVRITLRHPLHTYCILYPRDRCAQNHTNILTHRALSVLIPLLSYYS